MLHPEGQDESSHGRQGFPGAILLPLPRLVLPMRRKPPPRDALGHAIADRSLLQMYIYGKSEKSEELAKSKESERFKVLRKLRAVKKFIACDLLRVPL